MGAGEGRLLADLLLLLVFVRPIFARFFLVFVEFAVNGEEKVRVQWIREDAVPGTSHITRHTSHITRHASNDTRHKSHVTRYLFHGSAPSAGAWGKGMRVRSTPAGCVTMMMMAVVVAVTVP